MRIWVCHVDFHKCEWHCFPITADSLSSRYQGVEADTQADLSSLINNLDLNMSNTQRWLLQLPKIFCSLFFLFFDLSFIIIKRSVKNASNAVLFPLFNCFVNHWVTDIVWNKFSDFFKTTYSFFFICTGK